jgi:hypothetical protein
MSNPEFRVRLKDGTLTATAPKGLLTAEVVAGLREQKAELVEFLTRFGGTGTIQTGSSGDYLGGHGVSWEEWKARALNRLFKEQGATGRPGRITASTVAHGEERSGGAPPNNKSLSYVFKPDKPDNWTASSCTDSTYDCRVSPANPTTPDKLHHKPDNDLGGEQ